jgi:hypothetical protein
MTCATAQNMFSRHRAEVVSRYGPQEKIYNALGNSASLFTHLATAQNLMVRYGP